jgi:hypothetical protein
LFRSPHTPGHPRGQHNCRNPGLFFLIAHTYSKPTHSLATESREVNFSGKSSIFLHFVVPY